MGEFPLLQFAVFDEFGKGADDRVWDYGRQCFEAGRALLARTEAGADGVDTFAEWLATEMPAGTVIGNPAWWANRIARQYRVRSGVTQPQDASGDAERYRWLAENAIIQWPGVTHIGDDPASTRLPLDNAIDAAMRQEAGNG